MDCNDLVRSQILRIQGNFTLMSCDNLVDLRCEVYGNLLSIPMVRCNAKESSQQCNLQ